MKNIIKQLAVFLFVSTSVLNAAAEIPTPPTVGGQGNASTHRTKDTSPVGTGTMLVLGLGCGVLCYKVRKNRKEM